MDSKEPVFFPRCTAGTAEATEGPVHLPAGARRPGAPQQGTPAEERHVRQNHAQEQAQDQEAGEASDRPQLLAEMTTCEPALTGYNKNLFWAHFYRDTFFPGIFLNWC